MTGRVAGALGLLLLVPILSPISASGQSTGAGATVPGLSDALARIAPSPDRTARPSLLRRGGQDLEGWILLLEEGELPSVFGSDSRFILLAPELRVVTNSALSHSLNEGSLWASRGLSSRVRIGGELQAGRWRATVAPEVSWSRNLPYQIIPSDDPRRHPFASPWHGPPALNSADLPLRPGADPFLILDPGQSSVAYHGEGYRTGVGTENRWWGPGLVNALVLSGHAPGFPHAFLETTRPHPTRLGGAEAAWFLGRLVASPWYAGGPPPGARTVSGLAASLAPLPGLRVGFSRIVVRPDPGGIGAAFDPILAWDPIRDAPEGEDEAGNGVPKTDQVFSFFFQIAPSRGVEVYGEWARMDPPDGVREFLETPHHSQGYTVGFQWRSAHAEGDRSLRVHGEVTNLEQTRVRPDRPPPPPFYTGRATTEGLTHRGRVLGAAVGPGAQSQHLAVDFLGPGPPLEPDWWGGLLLGRVRWENDTFTRLPLMTPFSHDTSFLAGVRGGGTALGFRMEGSVTYQLRLNYLFQNGTNRPGDLRTVDVTNWTVGVTLRPTGERLW
jgi:hypothetical protein